MMEASHWHGLPFRIETTSYDGMSSDKQFDKPSAYVTILCLGASSSFGCYDTMITIRCINLCQFCSQHEIPLSLIEDWLISK